MEDLFKKIPSLMKSSKKSSQPNPRSTTPSPPPATLPPPLPAPDIPIQLPVGPLLPPPVIIARNSQDDPIFSTAPLPLELTQTAVLQRDQATKVFVHSPLSKQFSLSEVASQYQQQEQIEKQRGRYRFRSESADPRRLASRSPSQGSEGKADRRATKTKNKKSPSPTIPPPTTKTDEVKNSRSGPATTFEQILGIDDAPGMNCSSRPPQDDFAFCVSGSSASVFGTGSTICRMRKDPATQIIKTHPDSAALIWGDDDDSIVKKPRSLAFCRSDSLVPLISSAAEPGLIDDDDQIEVKANLPKSLGGTESTKPAVDDEYSEDNFRSIQNKNGRIFKLNYIDNEPNASSYIINRSPSTSRPSISDTSDSDPAHGPSVESSELQLYTPQMDGNNASKTQGFNAPSSPTELLNRPDPFGFLATVPTEEAVRIAEEGRQASFLQRIQGFFTSKARNMKARTVHVLTTGPDMENTADANMNLEEPGEPEEDMGTRKAKAVVRSWSRTDLVTCYVFLVILTAYFSLGSVHSTLIIKEALNDWATKEEIKIYQFELALSMLGVTRILGIMIFAKLTNAYSRPCALFVAVIFAIGGIGISAFAVTWESFCAGHAVFHFGRSGALVVAQVIVADTSDLSWRGCFTWGLESSLIFWIWTLPAVEKLITSKLGWHVPIWIFFGLAFPVAIPPIIATYVFHRRASHWGFFPAVKNVHWRPWWSLGGFRNRTMLFGVEYDSLGVFLWTVGLGLLSTALSLSEKMQVGVGIWMVALLVGGGLAIITLIAWEVWLNNGLRARKPLRNQPEPIDCPSHIEAPENRVRSERTTIPGPAGHDSASVTQAATQISVRILASQDPKKLLRWKGFGSCRERSHPLFRTRLLKRRTIPLGCLIGFLASFSAKAGVWAVWERPENLPLHFKQFIEIVQGKEILANIEFTSMIVAGLFVAFMMRITKFFKWFVVSGLLLVIAGLLTFHFTDICLIGQRQLVFSQTFTGLGVGMIWSALMVGIQASCKRHSDVAISIGLFTTFNALGEITAEAMKRVMQTYLLSLLSSNSSLEDFSHALNGHWSVMLLVAIATTAFALVMAGVGISNHNMDEVKQHISGVVFGIDDAKRRGSDEEHSSWATPEPFTQSSRTARIKSSGLISPSINAIRVSTQAIREDESQQEALRSTSGSSETTSFAQSRTQYSSASNLVVRDHMKAQIHGSAADWETSTSESITSESHTRSDSRTATSPTQISSSYVDGVFAMDIDIEKTPRANAPGIFESYYHTTRNLASSPPPVDTNDKRGEDKIKRNYPRNPPATESSIATEGGIISGQGFSFKKRKIGTLNNPKKSQVDHSDEYSSWSDSPSADSEVASINGFSDNFDKDLVENANSTQASQICINEIGLNIFNRNSSGEYTISSTETLPASTSISNFENEQTSAEASSEEFALTFSRDKVLEDKGEQNLRTDGRVSRFSYRDNDESGEYISSKISMLADTSQLTVDGIRSKVNALTAKNCRSVEKFLSPVLEQSSQSSLEDIIALPLEESLSFLNPSSRRTSGLIGSLPPYHYLDTGRLEEERGRQFED